MTDLSKLHSFPEVPYEYQKFPMVVYQGDKNKNVATEEELEQAHTDGWSDSPSVAAAPDAPAEPQAPSQEPQP